MAHVVLQGSYSMLPDCREVPRNVLWYLPRVSDINPSDTHCCGGPSAIGINILKYNPFFVYDLLIVKFADVFLGLQRDSLESFVEVERRIRSGLERTWSPGL